MPERSGTPRSVQTLARGCSVRERSMSSPCARSMSAISAGSRGDSTVVRARSSRAALCQNSASQAGVASA